MHNFPAFNQIKLARHGTLIYNHFDQYVGQSIEMYSEFSEGEAELFVQLIKPGMIVLDIGANIGAHTLLFARLAGPTGAVLAFEPQRVIFQTLCGNMAINSVTNAHCHCAAVGSAPGTLLVPQLDYSKVNNFGGLGLGQFDRGENVPVLTVDSLGLPNCGVMKVDVEGMEIEVLRGAAKTIERYQPILYVENDREEKSKALIQHVAALNYKMFWHRPALFNANNFAKNPTNLFGNIVSMNMLCLPAALNAQVDPSFQPVKI